MNACVYTRQAVARRRARNGTTLGAAVLVLAAGRATNPGTSSVRVTDPGAWYRMYTYRGNLHIHSRYSDGSGTIAALAAEAAAAGLDFIAVTDHGTLAGLAEEGYRSGVLVLVGCELNSRCNHYLAFGIREEIPGNDADPQQVIDAVRAAGGLGFLAHPFEKGSPWIGGGKAFPWKTWPVKDFTGLELWNYCSQWRSRSDRFGRTVCWYLFDRHAPLAAGPPLEALRFWDRLAGERLTPAIGGTDAHATAVRFGPLTAPVFPYAYLFRTINTYVILEQPLSPALTEARAQIYGALARGNCYIAYDRLHPGRGFACTALDSEGELPPGSTVAFRPGLALKIRSPSRRTQLRIIKNGCLVYQKSRQNLVFRLFERGVYRVEAYYHPCARRPRPWIYVNHFYVV